jgi:hypothetical protein
VLRVQGLERKLFTGDEFHSLDIIHFSYSELLRTFDEGGSGVALPILQKMSEQLFGANEFNLRLPALVPGLLAIPLSYAFFRLFFESLMASFGCLLFAVSHYAIHYSRTGRIYSLSLLLAILSFVLVLRIERGSTRSWEAPCLVLIFGLMLFAHLSNALLVAACALYLLAGLVRRRAGRGEFLRWALGFGGAGALALLLYLPSYEGVAAFFEGKAPLFRAPIRPEAVLELLSGGTWNAAVFAILAPLGVAAGLVRRAPHRGFVLWTVTFSVAGLLLIRPHGSMAAYARYLVYLLPVLLVAVMDAILLLTEGTSRLIGRWQQELRVVGLAAFALFYWGIGYEGFRCDRRSNFDHMWARWTYGAEREPRLSLVPVPYEAIAADASVERLVEFPLFSRPNVLVLGTYYAVHGKDVYIGDTVDTGSMHRYVNLFDLPEEMGSETLLFFHKDVPAELRRFRQTRPRKVSPQERRAREGRLALWASAERSGSCVRTSPTPWIEFESGCYDMAAILDDLDRMYGPRWMEDESVVVYRLGAPPAGRESEGRGFIYSASAARPWGGVPARGRGLLGTLQRHSGESQRHDVREAGGT